MKKEVELGKLDCALTQSDWGQMQSVGIICSRI